MAQSWSLILLLRAVVLAPETMLPVRLSLATLFPKALDRDLTPSIPPSWSKRLMVLPIEEQPAAPATRARATRARVNVARLMVFVSFPPRQLTWPRRRPIRS